MFAVPDTSAQLTGDANGWQGSTLRNIIAGGIVACGGQPWRATFKASGTGAAFDSISINGVHLTFAGFPGAQMPGHAVIASDWNSAPVVIAGQPVTVETHFNGVSTLARRGSSDSNYASVYRIDGQSGFTSGLSEDYWFCGLEIQDSGVTQPPPPPPPPPPAPKGSRTVLIPSRFCDCLAGPVPSIPANPNTGAVYLGDVSRVDDWADLNVAPGSIPAYGDSLTAFADFSAISPIVKYGIGGEKVEGILSRLAGVAGRTPLPAIRQALAALLMIGVNNINNGDDLSTLITRTCALIDWLSGPLVVTGVTQQTSTTQQARTATFNSNMAAHLAGRANAVFIDMNPILAPGGVLLPQFSRDGLHWTDAAYAIWYSQLAAALRSII